MIRLASALTTLVTSEDGATMVEYAVMLACIAVVCFGTVRLIGGSTSILFDKVNREKW